MAVVMLSLILMAADYKKNSMGAVRTALSIVVYPIQQVVNFPQSVVAQLGAFFSTHDSLSAENRIFRKKLEFASAQQKLFQDLKFENESLRKQLVAKPKNFNKYSLADILSISRGNFKQESTINIGKDGGVSVGQPVLSFGNMYGQVVEVFPYTSVIIQLSDPKHTIPVYNKRNGQSALATGTGKSNLLKLKDVVANADVRVGDVYVSSGFGQLFPANYPVAKVTEVKFEPDDPYLTVVAETFVNYDTSREVLLVWKDKNKENLEATDVNPSANLESNNDG